MSPAPVLIDWVNACSARPALDVARSYLFMRFQGLHPARAELEPIAALQRMT